MALFELVKKLIFNKAFLKRRSVSSVTEQKIKEEWRNISTLLAQKGPSQLKQALITADKTLDNALKDIAVGETMGERLKAVKDRYDKNLYNKLWEAHKIRNNLVHETGYEPPYFVVTEAVDNLRAGLVAIGVRL